MLYSKNKRLLIAVFLGMTLCTAAMAQYAIPASVVSGGASAMSGTAYAIRGSVGQPLVGSSSNTSYWDLAGFWYAAGSASANAVGESAVSLPQSYSLEQNYPNPFNPTTEIRFALPQTALVELKIYNSLGQLVTTLADGVRPAGSYRVSWDGKNAASGLYIYQLKAGSFSAARKMLLMK